MKEERIDDLTNLLQEERASLARFAWRCLALRGRQPDPRDVEDALSDAYLTAATLLLGDETLQVRYLGAWFRKIIFFRCLRLASKWSYRESHQTIDDLEAQDEMLELVDTAPGSSNSARVSRLLVSELLRSLDPRSRQIVELAAEGYTSIEIASRTGESAENVRQLKSRAVARLRREFSRKLT